MTTTAQTVTPFTVLSGDTKAGPLQLGNRSPSRSALVGFYAELERVAQKRLAIKELAARDQATQAIRADLEGRGLLKVQSNGNGEQARCHKTD